MSYAELAAFIDPPIPDVFSSLGYAPTARQTEFHAAAEWDVLYGGAAGGGKTRALTMHGLRACVLYPGIKVLAIRETYQQLAESFLEELAKVGYARSLGATYTSSNHDLTFDNGSSIRFRYCDGLQDAMMRLGSEIQLLLVDEATQQDPAAIDFLAMRIRSSNPAIPVLGLRLASNPGGVGHSWAKSRYVDGTNHGGRVYEDVVADKPTGHMVRFIPARFSDNPYVPDYESTLDAVKDERLRVAYRDGSWTTFAGQVFVEWSHDRHVIRPFPIPAQWRKVAGIDWGFAAPFAVEWVAQDEDQRAYVYRELYEAGVGESEQARRILEAEGNLRPDDVRLRSYAERVERYGDPSMWDRRGEANPIAHTYAINGVDMGKANNSRPTGWTRLHEFLSDGPACRSHREQGWKTCPRLHVFDTCANLIRTLPDLPADLHKPEDVDTDAEDHAADALRYALVMLSQPRLSVSPLDPEPRDASERAWKQLHDKRRRAQRGDGITGGLLGSF